jgi:cysteinyl-tRNA synthetase
MVRNESSLYVSLEKHFESRISALEKNIEQALHSAEKAAELLARNMETRMDGLNHVKEMLKDMKPEFVSKSDHAFIEAEIKILQKFMATAEGKASQSQANITLAISIIAAIIGIIGLFLSHRAG